MGCMVSLLILFSCIANLSLHRKDAVKKVYTYIWFHSCVFIAVLKCTTYGSYDVSFNETFNVTKIS